MVRWWDEAPEEIPRKQARAGSESVQDRKLYDKQYREASQLLEDEALKSQTRKGRNGDIMWLQSLQKGGTLSDRTAALTLLVRQAPLHRLKSLEQLIGMAKKRAKHEVQVAMDALKDLFLTNLLPPDAP
eukprot:m51a1_g18 hypothetical protein (129) ;mRNA; f:86305-86928